MSTLSDFAKDVIRQEAEGLRVLEGLIDAAFEGVARAVLECQGHVVVTGVGKPWLIGQKISATLASTGTPSFALHPSEAVHGDLGRLRKVDLVMAISNSGESEEVTRLLPVLKRLGCRVVAVTANPESSLARHSDLLLRLPKAPEACPIGMAPSVSTTAMLALGDALALAVMKGRNFTREDYARFHPGGALGRSLMRVTDIMRPLQETPVVGVSATVADALTAITLHKTGAAFVVQMGVVRGVFTDGDLRRHVEDENLLSQPILEVMTSPCLTVQGDRLAPEAVRLMQERRIGELPVVDAAGKIQGHISLKDLAAMHFM